MFISAKIVGSVLSSGIYLLHNPIFPFYNEVLSIYKFVILLYHINHDLKQNKKNSFNCCNCCRYTALYMFNFVYSKTKCGV